MGIRIEGHIVLEDNHFSDVVVWDNSGYGVSVPRRSDGAIFERMTVGENIVICLFGVGSQTERVCLQIVVVDDAVDQG